MTASIDHDLVPARSGALVKLRSAPHAHDASSVTVIMAQVGAALVPATIAGFIAFGWSAVFLWAVTVLSALAFEAAMLRLQNQPVLPRLADGSAILAGWILALSLPPGAPWWIGAAGSGVALVVGKHVFGGLGQNPFNPAMVARATLLVTFPLQMTRWPAALSSDVSRTTVTGGLAATFGGGAPDVVSAASPLGIASEAAVAGTPLPPALGSSLLQPALLGTTRGSLGETSALLLVVGGLFLLQRRVISWHVPVSMIATVVLLATPLHLLWPDHLLGPGQHVTSGALLLAAFFIATDPVTSPSSPWAKVAFGAGCGALVFLIRTWGSFPEGVAFAVLAMNALTPLLDRYLRPRVYGRRRNGDPVPKHGVMPPQEAR